MALITRKTDYALRILRTLSDGGQYTAAQLCERELVPQQFAYKILKRLERAAWVRISRGVDGGCRLAADLKLLSLYDLMQVMEDEPFVSACTHPGFSCAWRQEKHTTCAIHGHLGQIQSRLDEELKKHSLAQVLMDESQRGAARPCCHHKKEEPFIY